MERAEHSKSIETSDSQENDQVEDYVVEEYEEMEIIKTDDVKRRMDELEEENNINEMQIYDNQTIIERDSRGNESLKRSQSETYDDSYIFETQETNDQSLLSNEIADEYTVFGQFVANELRSISKPENRKKLKLTIQRAIIDITESDD